MASRSDRRFWDEQSHTRCLAGDPGSWDHLMAYVHSLCRKSGLGAFERDRVRSHVIDLLWMDDRRRLRERPAPRAVPAYVRALVHNCAAGVRSSQCRLRVEADLAEEIRAAFVRFVDEAQDQSRLCNRGRG